MKDRDESLHQVKGLFTIAVTPFTRAGDFDFDGLRSNMSRALDIGYDGLLIGGTYGEFPSMTPEERAELFRQVMDCVGERVPVLLCTAHSDPRTALELTKLAGDLGGLPMLTAPYVAEVVDRHIEGFFEQAARISKTGIMIYNAPGIGITLSPSLIARLAEIDGVVALKQGDLSPSTVDILCGTLFGKIRLFAASDLALLGPLALGFDGVSSTNSCALPELIASIYAAMQKGDVRRAGELHRLWYPIRRIARRCGQPQTTKALMNLRGWRGGHVRPPLQDLTPNDLEEARQALAAIGAAQGTVGSSRRRDT